MAKQARVRPSWKKQSHRFFKRLLELRTRRIRAKIAAIVSSLKGNDGDI